MGDCYLVQKTAQKVYAVFSYEYNLAKKVTAIIRCLFLANKKKMSNKGGQVKVPEKKENRKYLAVNFDDFRPSDFSWVIPLLMSNDFHGTFNLILKEKPGWIDKIAVKTCLACGMEIGDHTFAHVKFPYYSPLFNGQNPDCPDGLACPFPTNDDMKCDRGDGKNIFGCPLKSKPLFQSSTLKFDKTWSDLSNDDCQRIRNQFSVYSNPGIGDMFDRLSNRFLGTTGKSRGSWNGKIYTGGIFTGCTTSENHEIWERILEITALWSKKYFPEMPKMTNWSMPGSEDANLFYEKNGFYYYDREMTKLANDSSKFHSSLYQGNPRSWTQVLSHYGYLSKSDAIGPGFHDGDKPTTARHWFVNGLQNRMEYTIKYPIEHSVRFHYSRGYGIYSALSIHELEDSSSKMYHMRDEGENDFYQTIETLRNQTSQGIISGSLWDSSEEAGEKIYWKAILTFCKKMVYKLFRIEKLFRLWRKIIKM